MDFYVSAYEVYLQLSFLITLCFCNLSNAGSQVLNWSKTTVLRTCYVSIFILSKVERCDLLFQILEEMVKKNCYYF